MACWFYEVDGIFCKSTYKVLSCEVGGGSSSKTIVIIIVPIVILVAVLVILAVAIVLKRIKKIKQENQNDKSHVESLQFDFNAVKVAIENFLNANMLGRGGFGSVYKLISDLGQLEDGRKVTSPGRIQFMPCYIGESYMGLLCVQDNSAYRPTMASMVLMLSSYSMSLPVPSRPAFSKHSIGEKEKKSDSVSIGVERMEHASLAES
ncbi:cysteine-rich receptor-like protein kinase 6 [Gossypium hirsutum]|uniref:Cysteine-rich receptor-like protein kinase 6 n=1 Tax=Gossypium hirsutum TaxID=3635 RepID=A0ABM3BWC8_GOSHI|nr:cysteine-rich receptor-like protein kinase 6 [Gossypium hirsutum]